MVDGEDAFEIELPQLVTTDRIRSSFIDGINGFQIDQLGHELGTRLARSVVGPCPLPEGCLFAGKSHHHTHLWWQHAYFLRIWV